MPNPGFAVLIDWAKNGSYTDPGDDVTGLVLREQSAVTAEYGRDQVTALAPSVTGRGGLVLNNQDRRFSPRATTLRNGQPNPLAGKVKPARPVKITRTVQTPGVSGTLTTYTLFVGHTDDQPVNPDLDAKTASLSLVDSLADFREQQISTGLHRGIRTGQAIGLILDACGWPPNLRDLDVGATIISWWWEDGTDAFAALEKVVRSEGPPALLTVGSDGEIIFRDRHHRLTRSESSTAQQTWRAAGGGLVMGKPFTYSESWGNLINTGTVEVEVRTPQERQTVWTSEAAISLEDGEQRLVTMSASDPFYDAVTPVAGADWTEVSGTVTARLLRKSGASVTVVLTGETPAVITGLRLRARPVTVSHTVRVSARDGASIGNYGPRSFPNDLPWCGPGDAEAVLQIAVGLRMDPLPIVTTRFLVGVDAAKVPLLGLDIGARVRVVEPETATDRDFYVESIAHEMTGPRDHAVTFGLEAASAQPGNVFRLDTAGAGADRGYVGNLFVDTANLMMLDSNVAGHRLDSSVAAA